MAYNAGDIESKLDVDKSPFITGLKETLAEAEKWKKSANKALKATADVDQKPFNRALTAMQAKLTKTFSKTYTAKVRIDDTGQLPKLTELNKRLTAIGQRVARPQVKVDVDSASLKAVQTQLTALSTRKPDIKLDLDASEFFMKAKVVNAQLVEWTKNHTINIDADADVGKAMSQLRGLAAQVALLDGRHIGMTASVNAAPAISGLAATEAAADSADAGMSRYTKRLIFLGTAITLAVAPALGVLSTLLATIPVVSAGAALSFISLGMGFSNFATAVSNPVTASEIKRQKKALEELSPVARQVADYFNGPFKAAFKGVQQQVQNTLFKGVIDDLKNLTSLLPTLRQGLIDNAAGWNAIFRGMLGVITSAQGLSTVAQIVGLINQSLRDVAPMFTIATKTFMDLALVGAQTFGSLVVQLNAFAAGFDAMVQGAIQTGVLAEAFRQLANVTGALLYAFTGLMQAGFGAMVATGPALALLIRNLTDLIVAMMPSLSSLSNIFMNILNPALVALKNMFITLTPAFQALEGSSSALGPFISALGDAFNALLIVLVPIVTAFINGATAVLNFLGPFSGPLMAGLVAYYGTIAALAGIMGIVNTAMAVGRGIMIAWQVVTAAATIAQWGLNVAMLANPIGIVVAAIALIIAAIAALVVGIVLLIKNWDSVSAALVTAWDWIVQAWNTAITWIGNAIQNVIQWIADLPGNIAYYFGMLVGIAIKWAIDYALAIYTGIQNVIRFFRELPDRVRGFITDLVMWLLTSGKDMMNNLINGIVQGAVAVYAWFQNFPTNIKALFSDVGTWLLQTGVDIILGLWSGIVGAFNGLMSWIGGLITQFIAGVKAGLGIASPSTIFAEIGTFLIQGLLNGIQTAWGWIVSFFQGIWTGIVSIVTTGFAIVTAAFSAGLAFISNLWNSIWNSVIGFFVNVWNGIKIQATTAWAFISGFFNGALNAFVTFWSNIWNAIIKFFVNVWNGIKAQAIALWNALAAFWNAALTAFNTFWSKIWDTILKFFVNLWNNLKAQAIAIWTALVTWYMAALNAWNQFWTNIWNTILNFFITLWNNLKNTAINLWNTLRAFWDGALNSFSSFWSNMWTTIKNNFNNVFQGIIDIAKRIWQTVKDVFRDSINAVIRGVNWPIDKINGLFGINIPKLPEIGGLKTGGYVDWNHGPIPAAPIGPVRGPGGPRDDRVLTRLSNKEHVWSAREVAAAGGHDAVTRMRAQVLHGGKGQPNGNPNVMANSNPNNMGTSVMAGYRKLQLMQRYPNMDDKGNAMLAYGGVAPHVAAAGDEITRIFGPMPGGIGGVGARGNVSDHPSGHALDFMTLANSGLGDRVAAHLSGNWARMQVKYLIWKQRIANQPNAWSGMENRGSVTANHFDHVHASFLGGPNDGGGLFSIDYGAIFDALAGPFKPLGEGFLRGLIPVPPVPQWIEDMGVGLYNKAWDGLRQKAIELMTAIMGGGGSGGGNVEQWRPTVMAALARVGQPPSAADMTLRRMNQESGGNPRAINNWDSNARRGTPSKGLMQVIDPTFAAHRDPGLPNDIWNPLSNVVASMRYTLSRYGSLAAGYNRAGGYDIGGQLQPGWTAAFNGTGDTEPVLTQAQWNAMYETAQSARHMVNNNTINNGLTTQDIENLARRIAELRPLIGNINQQLPQGSSVKDMVDELTFELRHTTKGMYE